MVAEVPGEGLDPVIHELNRLRICAALASFRRVDLSALREVTDLSDSALSKHLRRLVEAGYVTTHVGAPVGRGRPPSSASLTRAGRAAYDRHVRALQALTEVMRGAEPPTD